MCRRFESCQARFPRRPKGTGSTYERDGVVIVHYEVHTPGKTRRKYVRRRDKKEIASKPAREPGAVQRGFRGR